jgi:hypothetical protein
MMLGLLTLTFMCDVGIRIFKETELRVSGDTNDSFVCLKLRITPHTRARCIACPHAIAYVVVLHSEEKRKKFNGSGGKRLRAGFLTQWKGRGIDGGVIPRTGVSERIALCGHATVLRLVGEWYSFLF